VESGGFEGLTALKDSLPWRGERGLPTIFCIRERGGGKKRGEGLTPARYGRNSRDYVYLIYTERGFGLIQGRGEVGGGEERPRIAKITNRVSKLYAPLRL